MKYRVFNTKDIISLETDNLLSSISLFQEQFLNSVFAASKIIHILFNHLYVIESASLKILQFGEQSEDEET